MIRAFDTFSLPLLRWLDPEDAHRLAVHGLRLLPPIKPRADDAKLAVRAFGLNFPNPIGMAAGFDKNARGAGRAAAARLRLCRDRLGDAAPAKRQSPATAVSPRSRRGRDQPHGIQQRRRGSRAAAARLAGASCRYRRRQCRREQGLAGPRRRLRPSDRDVRAARELLHRQRVLAQYAGPAQSAAGSHPRRSPGQGDRRPRAGARKGRRHARAARRSRRI